jgi:hypothetical protein
VKTEDWNMKVSIYFVLVKNNYKKLIISKFLMFCIFKLFKLSTN